MNPETRKAFCKDFGIDFPVIQAGMVWVSGGKLAAAAANAGILGVIGAGSMKPPELRAHILKAKSLTSRGFAVNVPLLYEKTKEQLEVALDLGVSTFITSAGTPSLYTSWLKDSGAKVIHVVSSPRLAKKCEDAGVDALVAEGFEAGGHNGREELTTTVLIPQVVDAVKIPVIAAGGIMDGRGIASVFALGATGAQMGTRFVATRESSAHESYKRALLSAPPDATHLVMKALVPVRLFKNKFCEDVLRLEAQSPTKEALLALLGKGRAKLGMLDGDLTEGELEIGQGCSMIRDIPTVSELVHRLRLEFSEAVTHIGFS